MACVILGLLWIARGSNDAAVIYIIAGYIALVLGITEVLHRAATSEDDDDTGDPLHVSMSELLDSRSRLDRILWTCGEFAAFGFFLFCLYGMLHGFNVVQITPIFGSLRIVVLCERRIRKIEGALTRHEVDDRLSGL